MTPWGAAAAVGGGDTGRTPVYLRGALSTPSMSEQGDRFPIDPVPTAVNLEKHRPVPYHPKAHGLIPA
jgi:hypothetical protein